MTRLATTWTRVALAVLVIAGIAVVRVGSASATSVTTRAADIADAYVNAAHPRQAYGRSPVLVARGGMQISYLRFAVRGLPAHPGVQAVRLHLRVKRTSPTGFVVYRVRTRWTERAVTWRTRPSLYPRVLARHGRLARTGWLTLVLPRTFVTRNGNYSLALVGAGAGTVSVASREARNRPALDIVVAPVAPAAISAPVVSGAAADGSLLTAQGGRFAGYPAPAVTDDWQRCDSDGSGCASTGSTGPTYTATSADVGHTVRVVETATNSSGTASATSAPTGVVAATPPTSTAPPAIQGQPAVGATLTATEGSWQGTTPQSYAFQWQRCAADGTSCRDVAGATSSTYGPLGSADVGTALVVTVTATNSAGQAAATSAATAPVTSTPVTTTPTPTLTPTATQTPSPSPSPSPTKTKTPSPTPSTSSPTGSDPVIAAAGDIACDPSSGDFNGGSGTSSTCRQKYTSNLLINTGLAGVLDLGDNQYYCGSLSAYQQSYDASWGRVKSITHPAPGNHEYLTSGGTGCDSSNAEAAGYFNYFGGAAGTPGQGWYSFDIGTWHLIALNSNCGDIGGCDTSSPQGKWLANDLKTHTNFCTLAFWHIPLYSSGGRAEGNTQSLYNQLYQANADLILTGHDHIYERFAPQDAFGNLDTARGIREFVVGTGGANHTSIAQVAANSEIRNATTFGVLRVTLHPTSYSWTFAHDSSGSFTDSGSQSCH